ncbi:probable glucosamine 6-phosphate N-acetyltransferase [Sitodiplosis mosellana]|uniref:probable glucosamine 6-phosphate N-acetyltransferase n=1 Tax=Sitodiplosis mosellana TaxID=263140 RepID=UPI002444F702|nr:probable glucosamine 6-phosphate N-acetyltransferase [Sitodiplosis mosellana]
MVLNSTFSKVEEALYDANLLTKLDFSRSITKFSPPITAINTGETWLKVRPLQVGDYDRGFLQLLSQLTSVGNISRDDFLSRFHKMKYSGDYFVTVIEDTRINQLIGSATLVIEHKFIHGCGNRARLEDVVVNNTYRGKQLGKLIVATVTLLAEFLGCYKMSLECKDSLVKFYTSIGYVLEAGNGNSMHIRYESPTNHPS